MRFWTWLGLALILCGLLVFYYVGQTLQIHCYRLEGRMVACASQIYWFDLFPVGGKQLFAPVTGAFSSDACTSRSGGTDGCRFFVVLQFENKRYTLEQRFFNQSSADKTADAINEFIASDIVFIDVYPSDKINLALTSCMGVPFFLLGALILLGQLHESGMLPIGFE